MSCNQLQSIVIDYSLLENITPIVDYNNFKRLFLGILINYNCQKTIIKIRYYRLLTPKHENGLLPFVQFSKTYSLIDNFIEKKCYLIFIIFCLNQTLQISLVVFQSVNLLKA